MAGEEATGASQVIPHYDKYKREPGGKSAIPIIGSQWGDEGKGKITNEAVAPGDLDARTAGGDNAGHTVIIKRKGSDGEEVIEEYKFNLVPSGVQQGAIGVLTEGTVINPMHLAQEVIALQERGQDISLANLRVSQDAHAILPWHITRDKLREAGLGAGRIGTTGTGIGEAYGDRTRRVGLSIGDVLGNDMESLVDAEMHKQDRILREMAGEAFLRDVLEKGGTDLTMDELRNLAKAAVLEYEALDRHQIIEELKMARDILGPMVSDTLEFVYAAYQDGKTVWGEAAQGALLDVDLGTRPYVTSSNTGLAGFIKVTGINARDIHHVIAVVKAYQTRVGGGPLPTELPEGDLVGDHLSTVGKEFGTRTGRKRRNGWFDAPVTRFGLHRIAQGNVVALTKLDVLDELPEIKICVGYCINGVESKDVSRADAATLARVEPIYETLPGWQKSTIGIRDFDNLPLNARRYIERLEELLEVPIEIVSVGPERGATIYRQK